MQETRFQIDPEMIKHFQEFFTGKTPKELVEKMDNRLEELKIQGHELIRRVELDEPTVKLISRKAPCPCGSGRKYKRCCMRDGLEVFPGLVGDRREREMRTSAPRDQKPHTTDERNADDGSFPVAGIVTKEKQS
jgi:hypothetical protein